MLAIFYTGDVRHNTRITYANHKKLFKEIEKIIPIKVYFFTRDDPERGVCPYDPPEQIDHYNAYRRGQGGAVQLWDFLRGVQRTDEPYIMRVRTDLWFTESSIEIICNEIKELVAGNGDIFYFGSDWINQNAGAIHDKSNVHMDADKTIQDFVILAKRDKLVPFDLCIENVNKVVPNKRRSGNKMFRYIIPIDYVSGDAESNIRVQYSKPFRILCQIWLVRKTYTDYPTDNEVCKDYIQSYIADDKAKMGKKNLIYPHPMQDAVNWWRSQQGWSEKEITIGNWWSWQSE
jgi:hypothetical protein